MANIWWQWLKERLNNLQSGQKCLIEKRNFKRSDVTLTTAETTNRGQWFLQWMEEFQVGADGPIKTVRVPMANDILCSFERTN